MRLTYVVKRNGQWVILKPNEQLQYGEANNCYSFVFHQQAKDFADLVNNGMCREEANEIALGSMKKHTDL